jgi:hypothetical protein
MFSLPPIEQAILLAEQSSVLVRCNHYGEQSDLAPLSSTVADALVETQYFRQFLKELSVLERIEALFERFPNSRHEWKIEKEHQHAEPAPDAEFERAALEDTEVAHSLRFHSFLLPKRIEFVRECVRDYAARWDSFSVTCPVCRAGAVFVEPELA